MNDVRVHVDRARPTCPFCKEAVAGGLVWVCPGCEASHHAACHDEHGDCASCALAEPREVASAATKGADDPSDLASRKAELVRLGFTIVREGPDELVAMHTSWVTPPFMIPLAHTVIVQRVPHLSLARLEADLDALRANPLASAITVTVYLAGVVDPGAHHFVETNAASRLFSRVRVFPAIRDASTGAGTLFTGWPARPPLGILTLPGARHLARRMLAPWTDPTVVPERLTPRDTVSIVFWLSIISLAIFALMVAVGFPGWT